MDRVKPQPVKIVEVLGLVEALAVAGYGVMIVVFTLQNQVYSPMSSLMLGLFFVLTGITIIWAVRMLGAAKSHGRSLLLVWQLFIIIIGVQTALAGQWLLGVPATAIAAVIVLLLFSTSVNQFMEPEKR